MSSALPAAPGHWRPAPRRPARPRLRTRAALMFAASAVLAGTVLGVLQLRGGAQPSAAQLTGYERAILPVVQDWGSVEMLGMRPAIADLQAGTGVPAATIEGEARAWRAALAHDRDRLRAVPAPAGLAAAAALFDRAISRYLDAAALFQQATVVTGAVRTALIDQGIAAAQDGDGQFDDASLLIQRARARLHLGVDANFPDHGGISR